MIPEPQLESNGFMPVMVDQRALIDKMLARYSGEFTVFRELLQNSDDAESSAVDICFKSAAPSTPPDLDSTPVTHWTIRNNGRSFTDDDWKRLTEIAAGNPDSRSIGAFGVGFYSVYSVTENPSISSQGRTMKFEWHGNQLLFKTYPIASEQTLDLKNGGWKTIIELPLRKPSPMPRILDFMRFLASSITFMAHLTKVQVFFDRQCVGRVEKTSEKSQPINLPSGAEKSGAKEISMNIENIQHYRITIKAELVHGRSKNTERVELSMFTAQVKVGVDKESSEELFRCMKKVPPSKLDYSLIYAGKDEHGHDHTSGIRSQDNRPHESNSIFQGLRADLNGGGHTRIFIGHGTTQTTGIAGHMASRFIPTVERELIDFSDMNHPIYRWNVELLHIGGALCRAVYEWELFNIQQLWEKGNVDSRPSPQLQNQLNRQFRHALRFFTFYPSTPSTKVAELLEKSFYACSSLPLQLLSSVGIRRATDIRAFDPNFAFLRSLPMLPSDASREPIITSLPEGHKIRVVEASDVRRSLAERALNEEELVFCLRWWIPTWQQRNPGWTARNLLHFATLRSTDGRELLLSSVQLFIDSRVLGAHIPRDGPLPEFLLPLAISQHFSREDLASLHWQEFTVPHWILYLSNPQILSAHPHYDLTQSHDWAGRVLGALSRLWTSLPSEIRREAREMLKPKTCVPTIRGLCRPEESYLPIAHEKNPFDTRDLAIVEFKSVQLMNQPMRALLSFLGVRGCVPPDLIIARVGENWEGSAPDLIRYLAQATVSDEDIKKLRSMRIFSPKAPTRNARNTTTRCRADELYPPEPIFITLQLPVISWDSTWSDDSEEAKLLYDLGLLHFPGLDKIIVLCSSEDMSIRTAAFPYFCDHLDSQYSDYDYQKFPHAKFIPAENNAEEGICLGTLEEVCWGPQWKLLGFSIAVVPATEPEPLYARLGIQQHPSPHMLLSRLRTTTREEKTAALWLECLADCKSSFTSEQLGELSGMRIVPTKPESSGDLQWVSPADCYLGHPKDQFTMNLFIFVNFGEKANDFLSTCNAKDVPSVRDVAESLIHDPDRFYDVARGPKGFMAKLGELAAEAKLTPDLNSTLEKMVSNHTLLGMRLKIGDQIAGRETYTLRRPEEIVIIDDAKDAELFSQCIWTVPQEDLESFYASIGCRKLSKVIQAQLNNPVDVNDKETSDGIESLVLERLPIFLERCTNLQPKIPWKSFCAKLKVRVCETLRISKTFSIGDKKTEVQKVWAATRDGEGGEIELWISRGARRDMYDLAISLCRRLFVTVRSQDTLVLAAMFSDRELLNRAGFNVKHDFKQHSHVHGLNGNGTKHQRCSSACKGVGRCTVNGGTCSSDDADSGGSNPNNVISQKSIRDSVKQAIDRCKSGSTRPRNQIPSPNAQSCNPVDNLHDCGKIEGIKIHVAKDVPDFDRVMHTEHKSLNRFVDVIIPLRKVFRLHKRSLHIFCDCPGGPIAFNKGGQIYLNLRYFKEWHGETKEGTPERWEAQKSWFFALAHEIAHNLVPDHNSDHEFWLAAICAEHVTGLSDLRQPRPGPWPQLFRGTERRLNQVDAVQSEMAIA
ncbi:hypothetical protein JVU11DRAFT_6029 [Chiua virens]|nr:hypothetical protein JVU11DRAFT_6029 [Chiua virens]